MKMRARYKYAIIDLKRLLRFRTYTVTYKFWNLGIFKPRKDSWIYFPRLLRKLPLDADRIF